MDKARLEMTKDRWLKDQPHAGDVTNHNAAHHRKLTVKEPPARSLEALSSAVQQAATYNMFIYGQDHRYRRDCVLYVKGMEGRKQVQTETTCVHRAGIQTDLSFALTNV